MPSPSSGADVLQAIVKRVVNDADPERLLRMGAPADEYETEIALITARVRELPVPTLAAIEDVVFGVWEEQFGPLVEGYEALYRQRLRPIAEALCAARPDASN